MVDRKSWDPNRGPRIVAAGAVNGLGFNTEQTWSFWRAEVTPFRPSPFRAESGERITMAMVDSLDRRLVDERRTGALMDGALAPIRKELEELSGAPRVALYHVVSEIFATGAMAQPRRALQHWGTQWAQDVSTNSEAFLLPLGNAGMASALLRASSALAGDLVDVAVVGGTQTYYGPRAMQRLVGERRVFDGVDMDTIIPGEGSAFVMLTRPDTAERLQLEAWAEVWCVAATQEVACMGADEPCTGRGLSTAMRHATSWMKSERKQLRWLLGDVTNEVYRTHEFGLAMPRSIAPGGLDTAGSDYFEVLADDFEHDFLPECFGDLGAATLPTATVIAAEAARRGEPHREHCLLVASSVGPDRGAILLGRT